jgi:hypothetical protein
MTTRSRTRVRAAPQIGCGLSGVWGTIGAQLAERRLSR